MSLYASANAWTEGICLPLQRQYLDLLGNKAPEVKRNTADYGFLMGLQSAANTSASGVEKVPVDSGDGQSNTVRVKYLSRIPSGQTQSTHNTTCAIEGRRSPQHELVDIAQYRRTNTWAVSDANLRALCSGESAGMFMRQFTSALDGLAKDINLDLLALQNAAFGTFRGGAASNTYTILNADGGSRMGGEAQMLQDFRQAGVNGTPIIVGEGIFDLYNWNQTVGLQQDTGFLINESAKFNFFPDYLVGDVLASANDCIAWEPGMVQLLTVNNYVGQYAYRFGERGPTEHNTFFDPVTGLTYDVRLSWEECNDNGNGEWTFTIALCFDLWHLPTDAFDAADELNGVNFTFNVIGAQAP